jgi:hypothetical protein
MRRNDLPRWNSPDGVVQATAAEAGKRGTTCLLDLAALESGRIYERLPN